MTTEPLAVRAPDSRGVLVATRERAVTDSLRSVAAATDQSFVESAEPIGRSAWVSADLVVLDASAARECAARLPRRDRVVVVCAGVPTIADWQAGAEVGADRVLGIPDDEDVLVAVFAERGTRQQAGGAVIAVVAGAGGAGASTMAAAVALEAARVRKAERAPGVLLIDADPLGSGLDLLLGVESAPGLRWSGLSVEGGRVFADALHAALPSRAGVSVLACGRGSSAGGPTSAAAAAVSEAGRRAGSLVVCDVARHPCEVGDSLVDLADLVVVVVPATVRGGVASERVLSWIGRRNPHRGIVVRGPAPGGLRGGDLAETLSVPVIAAMRPAPRLDASLEHGGLDLGRRSPLAAAARAVLDVLDARPRPGRWAA
ncbi:secretion/DNA translocation related CpaE-like protein [Rhodococcus sp. OK519]|uniref:septum site-determining protein Ssd n=1 Tax=Rhodococcus sp. OK519 TaxID=2135729 RepID=UPI000D3AE207|nr:secretion/DNA translocation related CpaE-like protein [Rhodococcus sp. OK519]